MKPEDIALDLLGLAVRLAPTLATWLADATHGKSSWWDERVASILPEQAKIHAAVRALEREQAP